MPTVKHNPKLVLGKKRLRLLFFLLPTAVVAMLVTQWAVLSRVASNNNNGGSSTPASGRTASDFDHRLDAALPFQNGNFEQTTNLTFLHIPKTGGASIVAASVDANLTWGDCLFDDQTMLFQCSEYSKATRPCGRDKRGPMCAKHTPIPFLTDCNPYIGKDVFAVVRNPFHRILSEYYYYCLKTKFARCKKKQVNNVTYMNEFIQNKLQKRQKCRLGNPRCYFSDCGHDIPQSDFLWNPYDDASFGKDDKRVVKWILHQENLTLEFDELMRQYGLQERISLPRINQADTSSHLLTIHDFAPETVRGIVQVYQKDFDAFGYSTDIGATAEY